MSKFICLCCMTFKKNKEAKDHCEVMNQLDFHPPYNLHKIFKQRWQGRFATWFFSLPGKMLSHSMGACIIYFVFINHFHIDFNWLEVTLLGIGMGLYIE